MLTVLAVSSSSKYVMACGDEDVLSVKYATLWLLLLSRSTAPLNEAARHGGA